MNLLSCPRALGLERIVKKFLFLPEKLQGHWKWLEFSWVRQRSERAKNCPFIQYEWKDVSWANRKEDKNVLSGWHESPSH
jgi:hypothetical protein